MDLKNTDLSKLEYFLGTLVVSLDDSAIELLTDICLFGIENKVAGFFTPASCDFSVINKLTGTVMDITVNHENKLYTFEYHYDSDTLVQTNI